MRKSRKNVIAARAEASKMIEQNDKIHAEAALVWPEVIDTIVHTVRTIR